MSEMSKKARAALREKAKRLSTEKDVKTDSSNWTPAEPLNAEVKTGMRPISRRAFKKGGKVTGEPSVKHAGRKPRQSGGKAITADSLINRNQKEANESREGIKHVGGLKRGGRAGHAIGGMSTDAIKKAMGATMGGMKKGGTVKRKGHNNGERVDEIANMIDADKTVPANVPMVMRRRAPSAQVPASQVTPAQARQMQQIMNRSATESAAADRDAAAAEAFKTRGYKKGGTTKARKAGGQVNYGPAENYKSKPAVTTKEQIAIEKKGDAASKPTRGKAQNYNTGGGTGPDPRMGVVKDKFFNFGVGASGSPYKKGGKVHDDEAMDKKLIKKMVKPSARTGKSEGGAEEKKPPKIEFDPADPTARLKSVDYGGKLPPGKPLFSDRKNGGRLRREEGGETTKPIAYDPQDPTARLKSTEYGGKLSPGKPLVSPRASGGKIKRPGKFYGGAMGGNAPQMIPPMPQQGMQMPAMAPNMGDSKPMGYAKGGKAKGKTNINIVISAGQKPQQPGMMPPPGGPGGPDGGPAGGVPVPMAAGPGAPPPAAAPMPMPMPMPMPSGAPPMPRKAGGRISKVASSYKDMTAGAGSGEGRLQKTDIAKRGARKAGGGVYRSYKDMDAGAGSGLGRLEKTEIQKRK